MATSLTDPSVLAALKPAKVHASPPTGGRLDLLLARGSLQQLRRAAQLSTVRPHGDALSGRPPARDPDQLATSGSGCRRALVVAGAEEPARVRSSGAATSRKTSCASSPAFARTRWRRSPIRRWATGSCASWWTPLTSTGSTSSSTSSSTTSRTCSRTRDSPTSRRGRPRRSRIRSSGATGTRSRTPPGRTSRRSPPPWPTRASGRPSCGATTISGGAAAATLARPSIRATSERPARRLVTEYVKIPEGTFPVRDITHPLLPVPHRQVRRRRLPHRYPAVRGAAFARSFGNAMREYALSIGKKNFTFGEVWQEDDEARIAPSSWGATPQRRPAGRRRRRAGFPDLAAAAPRWPRDSGAERAGRPLRSAAAGRAHDRQQPRRRQPLLRDFPRQPRPQRPLLLRRSAEPGPLRRPARAGAVAALHAAGDPLRLLRRGAGPARRRKRARGGARGAVGRARRARQEAQVLRARGLSDLRRQSRRSATGGSTSGRPPTTAPASGAPRLRAASSRSRAS